MKLLFENGNLKVYVHCGNTWESDALIVEEKGEMSVLSTSPGELEPLPGEFLINRALMSEEELKVAEVVMDELADKDSLRNLGGQSTEIFFLKKEYLDKISD